MVDVRRVEETLLEQFEVIAISFLDVRVEAGVKSARHV
jgi:hypothetical protein